MKKSFLLFFFLLSFSIFIVFAEENDSDAGKGSISGRIVDSENLPLPGAAVVIKSLNKGAVTDNNGVYRLLGLNPGNML